jgi:hypothetical protein
MSASPTTVTPPSYLFRRSWTSLRASNVVLLVRTIDGLCDFVRHDTFPCRPQKTFSARGGSPLTGRDDRAAGRSEAAIKIPCLLDRTPSTRRGPVFRARWRSMRLKGSYPLAPWRLKRAADQRLHARAAGLRPESPSTSSSPTRRRNSGGAASIFASVRVSQRSGRGPRTCGPEHLFASGAGRLEQALDTAVMLG